MSQFTFVRVFLNIYSAGAFCIFEILTLNKTSLCHSVKKTIIIFQASCRFMHTAKVQMWFCVATNVTWQTREQWVKTRPATWQKSMGMYVYVDPQRSLSLQCLSKRQWLHCLTKSVRENFMLNQSSLKSKYLWTSAKYPAGHTFPFNTNITSEICLVKHFQDYQLKNTPNVFESWTLSLLSLAAAILVCDALQWIFLLVQNPILWDKCCKRAECQPGCGCPTGSYHEEDGTMCWQVLDPRWDRPHQWSCQLRHGRRTREEQMCVLKWWGAISGGFLQVWKVTSEDSNAQQCPKLLHIQLVLSNIGEKCIVTPCVLNIHTRVFRFQHARVFKGEICNMNVFSIYVLYLSVQSCFPFECGHNAFQFIHMCFINYYDTGVWGNFFCYDAHFRRLTSGIKTRYWKRKLGINFVLHNLAARVALAEVQ